MFSSLEFVTFSIWQSIESRAVFGGKFSITWHILRQKLFLQTIGTSVKFTTNVFIKPAHDHAQNPLTNPHIPVFDCCVHYTMVAKLDGIFTGWLDGCVDRKLKNGS